MSEQKTPFELLIQLSGAGVDNALPLPDREILTDDWRGIGFRLAGRNYVVSMAEVEEVLTLPSYTKVPGVKSWLNGIANIRGRLLTVVDLGAMLAQQPCVNSLKSRLLTIRKGDLYSGVIVDEVLGLQSFSNLQQVQPGKIKSNDNAFVRGAFEKDGKHWTVFSLHQLADSADFLNVSA